MSISPEKSHSFDPYEFRPNIEDWEALQGGLPRVFRNPNNRASRWIVLHVYDEHPYPEKRFKSGAIIETIPPDLRAVPLSRMGVRRTDEFGTKIDHDIIVPSIMRLDVHGVPCEFLSNEIGGDSYYRIKNQRRYEEYVSWLINSGMEELHFGIADGEFKFTALPHIRPPRPIETEPTETEDEIEIKNQP